MTRVTSLPRSARAFFADLKFPDLESASHGGTSVAFCKAAKEAQAPLRRRISKHMHWRTTSADQLTHDDDDVTIASELGLIE